jgi:hypothetical protein
MSECYRFRFDPPDAAEPAEGVKLPPRPMFAAGNVVNGYARAVRGRPNSWRPDPAQPLPQWVELDFQREVKFNCVHVSFQSRAMRADDFRVEVPQQDGWRAVAEVTGNAERRRVLRFEPTAAPRLRLVLTRIQPDAGVCEIRVYDELAGN